MNCLLVTSPLHARGYSTNLYPANQTTMNLHLNSNLAMHACNQTASLAGLAGRSMQPNNHLLHAHSLATGGTGGPKGWPGYAVAYPKPALLYPYDFFDLDLVKFELQYGNYIDDIRHENNAKGLTNLVDLSVKLV